MSNTFVANLVPRILPTTLEVLREQLPLLGWANKNYGDAAGQLGDTVTIQKPQALDIGDVSPAMIAPSPSNLAPGYTTITINQWKKASFGLTQKEYAEIIAGNTIPFQVAEAVRTVCNQISATIWADYPKISNLAGKAGTGCVASNSTTYIASAAYSLDRALCPKGNRRAFLSLKDANDLRSNTAYGQYIYVGAEPRGENIVRDGAFKSFFDFKSVEQDYTVPIHTVGSFGGGTVAASGTNAAGSTSILVAVTGGGGLALKAGDVVAIGSETYPLRNTYSLTADATIGAGTTGTLYLNRGLVTAKSAAEAITFATTDGSTALNTSVQNIVGDPTGIGLVMRFPSVDLMGNRTLYESYPLVDPATGAILCLTYLGGYHQTSWEVSALYGAAFVDERKLCRLVSYTSF